jgi:hypothetical protein
MVANLANDAETTAFRSHGANPLERHMRTDIQPYNACNHGGIVAAMPLGSFFALRCQSGQ